MMLARKIVLFVSAVFFAVLALLGYVEGSQEIREHHEDVRLHLLATGHALRSALSDVWRTEGEARALALLGPADADNELVKIRWISASAFEAREGDVFSPTEVLRLSHGEEVGGVRENPGRRMVVYVPVGDHGAIELSQDLAADWTIAARIAKDSVFALVAALVAAALIALAAGAWLVGRPLKLLLSHMERIGQGDLGERLVLRSPAEFGAIATALNAMCDNLLEARARVSEETHARLEAVEQLRRADRLSTVGTLAAGMAHELGTPLSIVKSRAKQISGNGMAPADAKEDAQIVAGQVEKMTKLMRSLLDFARRKPAAKIPANLEEIAQRVLALLRPLAARNDVRLHLEAAPLAAGAEVDPAQFEQALTNVIINGIAAMDRGGELAVTLDGVREKAPVGHPDAGREGAYIRIRVQDQGVGIPDELLPRVFEPFFTTKDVGQGTGLGLSITHGILADHGGWIEVQSKVRHGSTFSMYFPRKEEP